MLSAVFSTDYGAVTSGWRTSQGSERAICHASCFAVAIYKEIVQLHKLGKLPSNLVRHIVQSTSTNLVNYRVYAVMKRHSEEHTGALYYGRPLLYGALEGAR